MTNEELIAQARELCERKIAEWQEVFDELISKYSYAQHQRDEINAWATHLAEMDNMQSLAEHLAKSDMTYDKELSEALLKMITTKAKRLLGE